MGVSLSAGAAVHRSGALGVSILPGVWAENCRQSIEDTMSQHQEPPLTNLYMIHDPYDFPRGDNAQPAAGPLGHAWREFDWPEAMERMAERDTLRAALDSFILAAETLRTDRTSTDKDTGQEWSLQTVEWAEWFVEKTNEARAALKQA